MLIYSQFPVKLITSLLLICLQLYPHHFHTHFFPCPYYFHGSQQLCLYHCSGIYASLLLVYSGYALNKYMV